MCRQNRLFDSHSGDCLGELASRDRLNNKDKVYDQRGWYLDVVSRSPKQDAESFLREMMVVGEDIRKPFAAHGVHADAVR